MKIIVNGQGIQIELVWRSLHAVVKALLPLLALLAAPEIVRLAHMLNLI